MEWNVILKILTSKFDSIYDDELDVYAFKDVGFVRINELKLFIHDLAVFQWDLLVNDAVSMNIEDIDSFVLMGGVDL